MSTPDVLIGKQLGNYRLERSLGRGGMASVYLGRDVKLGRPAAVKVVDAQFRGDPEYTRRFLDEAQIMATWRNENIPQVFYADEQDGVFFFAMEFIDGPTLAQWLHDHQPAPLAEVLRIGQAVAAALDYAHARGIIHRDVKPANVMLASDGRVVLTDFGLARNTALIGEDRAFGTAHYIAPEQARRASDATAQSDIYALGVMLYEMLAGRLPFVGDSPAEVALLHLAEDPPDPRAFNPDLPAPAAAVLLKALSKDPPDRYPTASALIQALQSALQPSAPAVPETAQPVTPLPLPPAPASAPPARRADWRWWAGGAVALAALVAVMANLWGGQATPALSAVTATASPASSHTVTPSATAPRPAATTTPVLPSPTTALVASLTPTFTLDLREVLATPTPLGTRPIRLFYNTGGFYLLNLSGQRIEYGFLSFELVDASGNVTHRTSDRDWRTYASYVLPNGCAKFEIRGEIYNEPAECARRYSGGGRTYPPGSDRIFWTSSNMQNSFRVLWSNVEIATCPLKALVCEVRLP